MNPDPDIETFLEYSGLLMNVNDLFANWEEDFVNEMAALRVVSIKESFRRGFAKSLSGEITLRSYERATGWDFDTPEELHQHLAGLWRRFYGDADPADGLG